MKIVIFHPVLLPPPAYGGVERVVLWLAQGLVLLGHQVYVAALGGSRLPAGVHLIEMQAGQISAMDLLGKLPSSVDVVHFMAPPEKGVIEKLPCASLLTVHGNGKVGERFPRNTVFLSADHARRHRSSRFVYNGIDPSEFKFAPSLKGESFLFLSKTNWRVKNLRGAMKMCRQARVPLQIAGGNRPYGYRLQAWLNSRMTWEGAVSGEKKADLLMRARALIFPVTWHEPFGLVVVEALMSGTPVLASALGSLPELIPPSDRVGALMTSEDEWIEKLSLPRYKWEPEACRAWAMEKFHFQKMAESYDAVYREVVLGKPLNTIEPETIERVN